MPFIVTLGTMGVARGLAKYLAGEQKVDAPAGWLAAVMAKTPEPAWLIVAPGVWMLAVLALAMGFVLTSDGLRRSHLRDRVERGDRAPVRRARARG